MVDAVCSPFRAHRHTLKEQTSNVLEELICHVIEFIIETINKPKLAEALKELINAQLVKPRCLSTATIGGASIYLWFVAIHVKK
jgi:hypothetical protein